MRRLAIAALVASVALVAGAGSAAAVSLGFDCISNNVAGDCSIGESQLAVEATAGPGANQVSFTFTNTGSDDSSITAVYFDADTTLSAIASILDGSGVDFEEGATPPNVPAGNDANPAFETTLGLSADSEPPVQPNGVNPGEELTIILDLLGGVTFSDVEDAIDDGSLRVAIHVQGFESGGSESFVNEPPGVIPEPSLGLLLAVPALVLMRRNRQR